LQVVWEYSIKVVTYNVFICIFT